MSVTYPACDIDNVCDVKFNWLCDMYYEMFPWPPPSHIPVSSLPQESDIIFMVSHQDIAEWSV